VAPRNRLSCPDLNEVFRPVDASEPFPEIKCRVCGVAHTSHDMDGRYGFFSGLLTFGPNQIDGVIDEAFIKEYRIYLTDDKQRKYPSVLISLPKSDMGNAINDCCDASMYQAEMSGVPLPDSNARLMVVPVDLNGVEMTVGASVPLIDITTTSTTTTATSTSTTRLRLTTSGARYHARCAFGVTWLSPALAALAVLAFVAPPSQGLS